MPERLRFAATTLDGEDFSGSLGGLLAYLAYGAGMALVVGVLAVATALAGSAVTRGARRLLPHVNRISGVLLLVAGLYVAYYGVYELRLYLRSHDDHPLAVGPAPRTRARRGAAAAGVAAGP